MKVLFFSKDFSLLGSLNRAAVRGCGCACPVAGAVSGAPTLEITMNPNHHELDPNHHEKGPQNHHEAAAPSLPISSPKGGRNFLFNHDTIHGGTKS